MVLHKYAQFKELLEAYIAKDFPTKESDNISPIISRYISFTERMGLNAEDKLKGLEEIFLEI